MNREAKAVYIGKDYPSNNPENPQDYIDSSHLMELFTETTKILLRKNNITSSQLISEFLQQSNKGEHVLLKSYGSFSKSYLCRLCFLYNFIKIFQIETVQRNGLDYFQLSRLLCSDYPKEFVLKAAKLLLPQQPEEVVMYRLLPSKRFIQAIYIFMIYGEYFDVLNNYFKQHDGTLNPQEIFMVFKSEDANNIRQLSKPPFSIVVQSLLSNMKEKGMFFHRQSPLTLLTQQNVEEFIKECTSTHPNKQINLHQILFKIVDNQSYVKLVDDKIFMFENSQVWSTEAQKLLSQKDPTETPLNVKKKASKK